jgi:hypothetical protein
LLFRVLPLARNAEISLEGSISLVKFLSSRMIELLLIPVGVALVLVVVLERLGLLLRIQLQLAVLFPLLSASVDK